MILSSEVVKREDLSSLMIMLITITHTGNILWNLHFSVPFLICGNCSYKYSDGVRVVPRFRGSPLSVLKLARGCTQRNLQGLLVQWTTIWIEFSVGISHSACHASLTTQYCSFAQAPAMGAFLLHTFLGMFEIILHTCMFLEPLF